MSMKKLLIFILKYFVVSVATLFISCQKESGADNDGYSSARKEIENSKLFKTIANTTWKHEKTEHHYSSGETKTTYSDAVITFTSECLYDTGTSPVWYYTNFNGCSQLGGWCIENGGVVKFTLAATDYGEYYTGEDVGKYIHNLGVGGKVVRLTDDNLTTLDQFEGYETLCHFSRYYGSNGGGSSSGGGRDDNDEGGYITCTWCKGSGKCHGCGGDGLWLGNAEECDYCCGSGVCEHCNGTGILEY